MPKAKKPTSFPLPVGPAVERFRQRVGVSVKALLPGTGVLADIVVAGYLVEAVHTELRAALFRLNEELQKAVREAREMRLPAPMTPTVVGMVRRKADYLHQHVGDIVGEVTRIFEALNDRIAGTDDVEGEVIEPQEPVT